MSKLLIINVLKNNKMVFNKAVGILFLFLTYFQHLVVILMLLIG
jgi:hypothetical protein